METSEISAHQVRVYNFVAEQSGWVSARDIAHGAQVSGRTARNHALNFVRLGVFDQAEVFPSHRYRLSLLADKRNKTFVQRLKQANTVFYSADKPCTGESKNE